MSVKRQQISGDQMDLFDKALLASLCHGAAGEGGTGPGACAEPQALTAFRRQLGAGRTGTDAPGVPKSLVTLPIAITSVS